MYSDATWYEVLFKNLYYIFFDVVSVYFTLYILIPNFLLKGKVITFLLTIAAVILLMFLNSIIVERYLLINSISDNGSIFKVFFQSTVTSTFIIALASIIKILKLYHSIKIEKVNIENINLQNELKILKNQITPHFFFNMLNNIDELIYLDKGKASAAIYHLSSILRTMLGEMSSDRILLETEIKFIENYLKLASYNFKNPDSISIRKSGNFAGKSIAPMLFLPLIENAIKYSDRTADGKVIFIDITINGTLSFSIKNKTKEESTPPNSTGIGLINLRKRLEHIYPGKHNLEIKNESSEFRVELNVEL
jgi:LytS/YehU family sensor histidine kinase